MACLTSSTGGIIKRTKIDICSNRDTFAFGWPFPWLESCMCWYRAGNYSLLDCVTKSLKRVENIQAGFNGCQARHLYPLRQVKPIRSIVNSGFVPHFPS